MGQLWHEHITGRNPSEKKSMDRAEDNGHVFITKDSHVVIMEKGCAQHEQPGDVLASLGGSLPRINPMIPDRS